MLDIKENNRIDGHEIHSKIESKTKDFSTWVNRAIEYADLEFDKDYFKTKVWKNGAGRPKIEYEFTIDASKEICMLERNETGKKIRRWLIGLSEQRENLDLITIKEAAFAVKVINCLKYIDNQKEAKTLHKNKYLSENTDITNKKYIHSEFEQYRSKIVGWDKSKVDEILNEYINNHSGYNRNKVIKKDMSTKLSIIDIGEAIRVAVLDILYSKDTNGNYADKVSNLCKKLAYQMEVKADKTNKTTLFRNKENISDVKSLKM